MIFKCYGVGPPLGCKPHKHWTYQNVLTVLQHGYAKAKYIESLIKEKRSRSKKTSTTKTPIYPIPLGYANQVEVPFIPFHKRTIDVSFAGSVVHRKYKWWSIQKWFKTPKSYSRSKMISSLQKFADKHTSLNVDLKVTPSFKAIRSEDPVSYSDRVMSTRISLVPRGASYETYRFFESIRFGCLVVAEYLPDFWFYEGAPVIRMTITATFLESSATIDPLFRVNAGGGAQSDTPIVWVRDTKNKPSGYNNADLTDHKTGKGAFTGTNLTDAPSGVYDSNRFDDEGGLEMEWDFPVTAAGSYEVKLYFAETSSKNDEVGDRIFDVVVEGDLVLDDYDIVGDVGFQASVMKQFTTVVSDGNIDIDFLTVYGDPIISAIEILPTPTTMPIAMKAKNEEAARRGMRLGILNSSCMISG